MSLPRRGDVRIAGVEYNRSTSEEGSIIRSDAQPATSRAAQGEGRHDYFVNDSFVAQASLAGGLGQERLVANDMALAAVADTMRPGHIFPARKYRGTFDELSEPGLTFYDAHGFVGMVESEHSATVTGLGATIAVRNGQIFRYDHEAESALNVTPNDYMDFELVKPLGRFLFAFGRTQPGKILDEGGEGTPPAPGVPQAPPTVVRRRFSHGTRNGSGTTTATVRLGSGNVKPGNMLVAMVAVARAPGATVTQPALLTDPSAWTAHSESMGGMSDGVARGVWTRVVQTGEEVAAEVQLAIGGSLVAYGIELLEIENLDTTPVLEVVGLSESSTSLLGGSQTQPSALDGPLSNYLVLSLSVGRGLRPERINYLEWLLGGGQGTPRVEPPGEVRLKLTMGGNLVPDLSWRGGGSGSAEGDSWRFLSGGRTFHGQVNTVGDWRLEWDGRHVDGSGAVVGGVGLVIRGQPASDPVEGTPGAPPVLQETERLEIFYSSDEGTNWTRVESELGGAIGRLVDGIPAMGSLFVTTETGLYRFTYEEYQFENGNVKVNVGMIGPLDVWPMPVSEGLGGKHLTILDQQLYYAAGSSIRRYTPGGAATQVWPTEEWSSMVGEVRGMIAAEGVVFFSANGFLNALTMRGIHTLAAEPEPGAFDRLYFHRGRLYFNSPATYFRFDYPSARPDFYTMDPEDFDTGYVISSALDLDKISLDKIFSRFETHVRWTADVLEGEDSGYVELQYLNGDNLIGRGPGCHYCVHGGLAGSGWVTIGEHHPEAGGVKVYSRKLPDWQLAGPEIVARKIYLRLVIHPGVDGYPVVEAPWIVQGVSLLPDQKTIHVPLRLVVGARDRDGNVPYPTVEDAVTALEALEALRSGDEAFDLVYDDGSEDGQSYRVVMATKNDTLTMRLRENGLEVEVMASFQELP